jgi:hypothetical protein
LVVREFETAVCCLGYLDVHGPETETKESLSVRAVFLRRFLLTLFPAGIHLDFKIIVCGRGGGPELFPGGFHHTNRLLSRAEWIQLILDASSRVVESLNAEAKEAEFATGMRRLAEICMSSFVDSNVPSVLPHPQTPPAIKMTLLGMFPEMRVTVPLNLPATFDELDGFVGQLENRRLYILGKLAGDEVLLTISGDVPMQEGVEEWCEGPVVVDFGDEKSDGNVLGHVCDTGAAFIALSDMRLILFNVPNALFPAWSGLRHRSAFYWTRRE